MSNFIYFKNSDNKAVASGVVASANSTASGYSVDNAILLPVAKVHRATGATSEYIELDLGSAQAITLAAVLNHNLSSAATITVKAGAAANPSTFTTTVTWREFDAFKTFTSETHRYWRFVFADATNKNGFIQVGYLLLGAYTQPAFNFQFGWIQIPEFNTRRLETGYLVPNVEELAQRQRFEIGFDGLTVAQADTVRKTLFESLKKDLTPWFFIPDGAVNDGYFGRFGQIEMQVDFFRFISVPFIEDGRGNRLVL